MTKAELVQYIQWLLVDPDKTKTQFTAEAANLPPELQNRPNAPHAVKLTGTFRRFSTSALMLIHHDRELDMQGQAEIAEAVATTALAVMQKLDAMYRESN